MKVSAKCFIYHAYHYHLCGVVMTVYYCCVVCAVQCVRIEMEEDSKNNKC